MKNWPVGPFFTDLLIGNTDDHARNHAAFWDGHMLSLTPAYDVCPQTRTGNVASQAMLISGADNRSQIASCLAAANNFLLSRSQALRLIEDQLGSIVANWSSVCDLAEVEPIDRKFFGNRQFLNPYVFENLEEDAQHLGEYLKTFRSLLP